MTVTLDPDEARIAIDEEPIYTSYSAFTQWLKCGKAYELSRLLEVRELPAWFFVGGTAFHTVSEQLDRELYEREGR